MHARVGTTGSWATAAIALLVVAGTATAGCARDESVGSQTLAGTAPGSTLASPTTSSVTTTTTTTTVSTTTASTTISTTTTPAPTTPEEHAKALVAAWRAGDRGRARQVADQASVDRLFSSTGADPASFTLIECGGAAGSTICRFDGGGSELLVTVRNPTGGLAPLVTGVQLTA